MFRQGSDFHFERSEVKIARVNCIVSLSSAELAYWVVKVKKWCGCLSCTILFEILVIPFLWHLLKASIWFSICLSIHLFIHLGKYVSIHLFIHLGKCVSIHYPFGQMCIHSSVYPFGQMCIHSSVYPFGQMCIHSSVYPFGQMCIHVATYYEQFPPSTLLVCVEVWGSCLGWSVYLTTRLLGRLSPLSG